MVFGWLRKAKEAKSRLPIPHKTREMVCRELRELFSWPEWPADITRHSCASYWLSVSGNASQVATALGHTEGMLRKHYMGLVTKVEAEKFFNL
jgi:hypothetical protein